MSRLIPFIFVNKCRLLVLLASFTQQCVLVYFPPGNSLLKIQLNGMPVAETRDVPNTGLVVSDYSAEYEYEYE